MKPITCLITATVGLALTAPAHAQADCADWNTGAFFEAAEISDVTRCLQAGADLNARTDNRWTALHFAAGMNKNPAVVQALLAAGVDPTARTGNGSTALHFAAGMNVNLADSNINLSDIIMLFSEDRSLLLADSNNNRAVIEALLNGGAEPNAQTQSGWTPLHVTAGMNKNPAVIEALLNAGADLSARDANGQTPLHHAAGMNKNPAVIEALLNGGAEPNAQTQSGATPLHHAAGMNKNPVVIEALLNAGADPNAQTQSGWTPLHHVARMNENPAMIEALLNAGADPKVRDKDDKTPWDYAKDKESLKASDAYWRLNEARFTSPISTHQNDTSESSNKHWVTSDRLNRRTCPSTDCGIVGQFFFREGTDVFEDKDGWARVSRYYDASCANGRSEYVDSEDSRCDPENGIVDGKFSEWVFADFLSEDRPPDPAADATGLEVLVAGSDDFQKYRGAFAQAAQSLISSGQCREADFRKWDGWMKSVNDRSQPIYFIYCGGSKVSNRLYLNTETGEVFR